MRFTILASNIALSKPLFSIMSMNVTNYIEIVESFFYFILKRLNKNDSWNSASIEQIGQLVEIHLQVNVFVMWKILE